MGRPGCQALRASPHWLVENSHEDLALRGSPVHRDALRVEIQRGLDLRVLEQVLNRLRLGAVGNEAKTPASCESCASRTRCLSSAASTPTRTAAGRKWSAATIFPPRHSSLIPPAGLFFPGLQRIGAGRAPRRCRARLRERRVCRAARCARSARQESRRP